ncbi:MAG: dCTP deaminase [Parcubacteria group bacterium]|nr:dCTP deaminase [Parcubacteria group bacterium]
MAIFQKTDMEKALADGTIAFEPALDKFQIQPNSVDLRLGWNFYIPETWELVERGRVAISADYARTDKPSNYFRLIKLTPGQYFEMLPHEFVIISTLEKITLRHDNIAAILYPRSSIIRRGLTLEGGVIDVHYSGYLTIPVLNATSQIIRLYPGERFCQIVPHTLSDDVNATQAKLHGLKPAKYLDSTPYNLQARSDSKEELDLVTKGDITKLKQQYAVEITPTKG